ncbi:hypothetical protein EON65_55385 [archaeon]|nr:MAG: hypothetical protein EON65_55385 [archaeon]
MRISREDESHLEKWLVACLGEIHQPSPDSLTKYIIALLKQDSDQDKLRQNVQEELQTFLKSNTTTFVSKLFSALQGIVS